MHDLLESRCISYDPADDVHSTGWNNTAGLTHGRWAKKDTERISCGPETQVPQLHLFPGRLVEFGIHGNREVDLVSPGLTIGLDGKRVPYKSRGPGVIELRLQGDLTYSDHDLLQRPVLAVCLKVIPVQLLL